MCRQCMGIGVRWIVAVVAAVAAVAAVVVAAGGGVERECVVETASECVKNLGPELGNEVKS